MASENECHIQIARRQPEHIPALIELFRATHIVSGYPVEGAPDAGAAYWRSFITQNDSRREVISLVACSDLGRLEYSIGDKTHSKVLSNSASSTVCGHISIVPYEPDEITDMLAAEPYQIPVEQLWKLTRFAVHPDAQGKGIGSMLLDAVEKEADQAHKTLALGVLSKDVTAIHLYESRGWKRMSEGYMLGRDGRKWEEVFYVRDKYGCKCKECSPLSEGIAHQ